MDNVFLKVFLFFIVLLFQFKGRMHQIKPSILRSDTYKIDAKMVNELKEKTDFNQINLMVEKINPIFSGH